MLEELTKGLGTAIGGAPTGAPQSVPDNITSKLNGVQIQLNDLYSALQKLEDVLKPCLISVSQSPEPSAIAQEYPPEFCALERELCATYQKTQYLIDYVQSLHNRVRI
jgi:hypothetical protein